MTTDPEASYDRVADEYVPASGPHPDSDQVGVVWLDGDALREARIYPSRLRDVLDRDRSAAMSTYWGDVN